MIKRFEKLVKNYCNDIHLRIALADISFIFPDDCKYPNLCVKVEGFGLINPLEGRTVATLPEVHLALYLGAKIDYHDAVIIDDYKLPDDLNIKNKEEYYVFRTHLRNLYELRKEAKANDQELLQQLYKTYSNGLYGKVSQGISERTSFDVRERSSKRLPKSDITNSYYASMITGLIRAALSELIVAINELIEEGYPYKIISATTDGLLYGIDESRLKVDDVLDKKHKSYLYDSAFDALRNGYKKFKPFEEVDNLLAKRLEKFPSLMLLKLSHEAWNDPEYIEIKHIANKVLNVKTRGQVGFYEE